MRFEPSGQGGWRMKKLLLMLVLPTLLYCNGKPKIHFDSLTHDFGTQARSVEIKHIFTFKNTGDGLLVINKIEPT
jgi:hypothetical protein